MNALSSQRRAFLPTQQTPTAGAGLTVGNVPRVNRSPGAGSPLAGPGASQQWQPGQTPPAGYVVKYGPDGTPSLAPRDMSPTEMLTPAGLGLQQVGQDGQLTTWTPSTAGPAAAAGALAPRVGVGSAGGAGGDATASAAAPSLSPADLEALLRRFAPEQVPRVSLPGPEDETAAQSAAYARAADRIRKVGAGAEQKMEADLTRRGISGSGLEARSRRQGLEGLRGQLGEVIRDQAQQSLSRTQAINDRNLSALLAQRGQDIGQSGWELGGLGQILNFMRAGGRAF